MKSKPIDWYDKGDLQEAMAFCDLLSTSFGLKNAEPVAQAYNDALDEFCDRCDQHPENCDCNRSYRSEYDDESSYED